MVSCDQPVGPYLHRHPVCPVDSKKNAKGFVETWRGYNLQMDTADSGIPVSCPLNLGLNALLERIFCNRRVKVPRGGAEYPGGRRLRILVARLLVRKGILMAGEIDHPNVGLPPTSTTCIGPNKPR